MKHDILCCNHCGKHSIQHTNKCPWCFRKYNDTPNSTLIIVTFIVAVLIGVAYVALS